MNLKWEKEKNTFLDFFYKFFWPETPTKYVTYTYKFIETPSENVFFRKRDHKNTY